jgi:hypothetical protein
MSSSTIVGQGISRPAASIGISDDGKRRSGMSLFISEPANVGGRANTAQWKIEVYVQTAEGEFLLGTVTTSSVASGARAARAVALAYCPGARSWRATLFGPIGATLEARLRSDDCCQGGFLGLVGANDARVLRVQSPAPTFLAAQGVLSAGPAILYSLSVIVDPALTVWVGPVDKAAAVANGDAWADLPIQFNAGGVGTAQNYVKRWREGLNFQNQIRWACSSTLATVTLAASASVGGETS